MTEEPDQPETTDDQPPAEPGPDGEPSTQRPAVGAETSGDAAGRGELTDAEQGVGIAPTQAGDTDEHGNETPFQPADVFEQAERSWPSEQTREEG